MGHADPLVCLELGLVPYDEALTLQRNLAAMRAAGRIGDRLLLLEHPPVLTKGRRTEPGELGMGEDWYRMQGIEVAATDRGGRATYHGPGQLVAYPIADIAPATGGQADVRAWVELLERAMIDALRAFGVAAQVFEGLAGVWTAGAPPLPLGSMGPQGAPVAARTPELAESGGEARKIGSIGIHVSRGISTHGLAINVNNDLQPFEWIVPCGIDHARMTSVSRELGAEQDFAAFVAAARAAFGDVLGREVVDACREELEGVRAASASAR